MVNRRLQSENLDILVENGGFKFTGTFFPYTSGEIGPYFVNSEVVMRNGQAYMFAVNSLVRLIGQSESPEVISCGESRDWCFGPAVAYQAGLACAMIYKDKKIIGADMEGKRVLHVADLNNEGSSPRDLWVPAIREAGGTIEDIVFYVDRLEAGVQVMQDLGLRSHAVVPLDDGAWEYLATLPDSGVNPEILRLLRSRTEMGKDNWALQMLKSEVGRNRWTQLYKDEKTRAKADKVAATYELKLPKEFSTEYFDELRRAA